MLLLHRLELFSRVGLCLEHAKVCCRCGIDIKLILGKAVILPGFMIVTSMFYTRKEHTTRVGYWCMFSIGYLRTVLPEG